MNAKRAIALKKNDVLIDACEETNGRCGMGMFEAARLLFFLYFTFSFLFWCSNDAEMENGNGSERGNEFRVKGGEE